MAALPSCQTLLMWQACELFAGRNFVMLALSARVQLYFREGKNNTTSVVSERISCGHVHLALCLIGMFTVLLF